MVRRLLEHLFGEPFDTNMVVLFFIVAVGGTAIIVLDILVIIEAFAR